MGQGLFGSNTKEEYLFRHNTHKPSLRGSSFFNLHTLLECFVSGYETLPGFLRGGMKHFGPSSSRV